jgi:hypothetical protein
MGGAALSLRVDGNGALASDLPAIRDVRSGGKLWMSIGSFMIVERYYSVATRTCVCLVRLIRLMLRGSHRRLESVSESIREQIIPLAI